MHFNNLFLPRARAAPRARRPRGGATASCRSSRRASTGSALRNPFGRWRAEAAELALALLGDAADASRYAEEAMQIAVHWGTPGRAGWPRARGMVVVEAESTRRVAHGAVELMASSPQQLEHARTLVELGAALRRAGLARRGAASA